MNTIECKTIKNSLGNVTSVLLFGLVRCVYSEKQAEKVLSNKTEYYCNAIDKEGNTYKIYTDYDPCLQISYTIAVKEKK